MNEECLHPRCVQPALVEFKARKAERWYCSTHCRYLDGCRIRQNARRQSSPAARAYERRVKLLKKYGITEAEWDALFTMQEGRCAICAIDLASVKTCVDHNHATGVVRGLLCSTCNQGLGYFGDDPDRLLGAAAYLVGVADRTLLEGVTQ